MSDFKLSNGLNKNKVFLVRRSEIEGRLDPQFYDPYYYSIFRDKDNWKRLNDVVDCLNHPPEYKRVFSNSGFQLIRSQNVRPLGIDLSETPVFLDESVVKATKSISPAINDILVVRSGVNAGDVAVVEKEYPNIIVGADTLLLRVGLKIIPKFVQVYFYTDVGRKQLNRYITGATNKHINSYSLKHVYFPILDKTVQSKCIELFENSIKESQSKQSHSKSLLESIDTYLLNELGIVLPQKDDSLKARMFTTKFSEVCGGRLDCELFKKEFRDCFVAIEKGKYKSTLLKNVLTFLESGSRPNGGVNSISNGILSFGGEHVNTQFEVGYGTPKYISEEYHKKIILTETKLNDIVLVKDGATTGKIGIIENEECINQNINEHVFLLRSNSAIIDQHYLCYYLHSTVGQLEIEKEITGATVTGISKTSVKNLRIPLPPLSKQIEIADHIKQIRQQAKQLEIEAEQILTDAKKEIEKMILREEKWY